MNEEKILEGVKSLVKPDVFAVLTVLTSEEEVILRPIGGHWGSGIRDAIKEMSERYPGCKMQLFTRESDRKYFDGIVSREQVLPYAAFSPELKAAINAFRRKVLG
ncbi:hypothetical protein IT084_15380 [Desulfallas sp. Bu1-1]|uniref:hypothetical protein n=1 Tax=Desulfallas sp. Bu1-1 TaxID=2787620 RepID=UPI00189E4FD4|nr:hypothetical protein [Desulfallas sp. Bu1-1]MBF7084335.1 hypothetical protein [Desulfallas sp. Bu1-1]